MKTLGICYIQGNTVELLLNPALLHAVSIVVRDYCKTLLNSGHVLGLRFVVIVIHMISCNSGEEII